MLVIKGSVLANILGYLGMQTNMKFSLPPLLLNQNMNCWIFKGGKYPKDLHQLVMSNYTSEPDTTL